MSAPMTEEIRELDRTLTHARSELQKLAKRARVGLKRLLSDLAAAPTAERARATAIALTASGKEMERIADALDGVNAARIRFQATVGEVAE